MLNQPLDTFLHPYLKDREWQMTRPERSTLAHLLARIKPKCSIEIGVFHGGSTALIASYSEKVHSIDINPDVANYIEDIPNVEIHIGDSSSIVPELFSSFEKEQTPLEFVLIDGDHSLEGVQRDCRLFINELKPTRPIYIAMHDSFNPDVREGIRTAGWEENPYVSLLDLDFVYGFISQAPGVYFRSMWGGIALAVLSPEKRQKPLTIGAALDFEGYLLLPFSSYTEQPDFSIRKTSYEKFLAPVAPTAQELRREIIDSLATRASENTEPTFKGHRVMSERKFSIHVGYVARKEPPQYYDISIEDDVWQPEVYALAGYIARQLGSRRLIDIGCGHGEKLSAYHPEFEVIGVDYGDNIRYCQQTYNYGTWIDHDLESERDIEIAPDLIEGAVVMCADVIEHLIDPMPLLHQLQVWSDTAQAVLISTPERAFWSANQDGPPDNPYHVREWTLEEFRQLLLAASIPLRFLGYTISNTKDHRLWTILAIAGNEQNSSLESVLYRFRASERKLPADHEPLILTYEQMLASTELEKDQNANAFFRLQAQYNELEQRLLTIETVNPPEKTAGDASEVSANAEILIRRLEAKLELQRVALDTFYESKLKALETEIATLKAQHQAEYQRLQDEYNREKQERSASISQLLRNASDSIQTKLEELTQNQPS